MTTTLRGLATRMVLAAFLGVVSAGGAAARERVAGIVHVHSDLTTGDYSLDRLAELLDKQGIGALLLSENYLLRVEYGLPPFRALTRVTREERSVLQTGLEPYLGRVADIRRRFPRLVIVPGVEVMPHYWWTGSPFTLDMTVHNTQKNLLVFGVTEAGQLRTLPATGNRHTGLYTWQSLIDALPVLLVVPGVVLLLTTRRRRRRIGRAVVVVRTRPWWLGLTLVAIAVVTVVRAWPFTTDRYPPWRSGGLGPYQALIDHVDRLGGVTAWSFPEAPDAGVQHLGPVRVSTHTEPHADDLLRTFRYTAFGAVYEQPTRVAAPGGGWDRLLAEFVAGERSRPAWAFGESGFHGNTAGKRLGPVQTVFLVDERSEAGVLEAFRRGRLYALHRTANLGLVLSEFRVAQGTEVATMGDTLHPTPGPPLEVTVGIEASDGGRHDVRVTLVKNGAVVAVWAAATPFQTVHRDTYDGSPAVFRVEVRAASPHHLLANPIFVAGGAPARGASR